MYAIRSYYGYMLMRAAANEYGWNLNYGGIALMWRGGCIIRSRFLGKIKDAVITSYSIHYTKLYDCGTGFGERALAAAFDADAFQRRAIAVGRHVLVNVDAAVAHGACSFSFC